MSYRDSNNNCKVYVGNLPQDIRERDLEDVFYKYGKIVDVDLHTGGGRGGERSGGPFAFVEFEDPRQVYSIHPAHWYIHDAILFVQRCR